MNAAANTSIDPTPTGAEKTLPYAGSALALLLAANFFNYLDRTIVSILGHRIQQDLGVTDAQLGFILGTAFAVLYGVFGIGMGRIADTLSRTRLMAFGLALWSAMTAISGLAGGFAVLALARIGVGVGEAVANPCSQSLLCDYFPARRRATVLGAYLAATQLGSGAALVAGGLLLQNWSSMCSALPFDACGVADWRAAFFFVGLPGIVLAGLIFILPEPRREPIARTDQPFGLIMRELSTAVPPFTTIHLLKTAGPRAAAGNVGLAGLTLLIGAAIAFVTDDWAQWMAVSVGFYAVASWAQVLRARDPALFKATFGAPVFMLTMFGGALLACFIGAVALWGFPYVMRTMNLPVAQVGVTMGGAQVLTSMMSVILGGLLTDRWKKHDPRAPVWMSLISLFVPIPILFLLLGATTFPTFLVGFALFTFFSMLWSGALAALAQDVVEPRMRGSAAAIFSLTMILVGNSIGPYWTGKISMLTGSLTAGLYSVLVFVPIAATLFLLAVRRMKNGQHLAA